MKNIEDINKAAIQKITANKKITEFFPGDTIKVGVKIVEGNIVRFVKIQIIEDVSEGIWVIGLPEKTKIITVGQEYVIDGQTVNVQTVGA